MPPHIPAASLTCEYLRNPLGLDTARPRLGWRLEAEERDVRQTAYQILVATSQAALDADRGDLWDTGRVASPHSTQRVYAGPPLQSRQRCFWKVRIWDGDDQPTAWSAPAGWEMGLLQPIDWQADFITPDPSVASPCPYLRTTFTIEGVVESARAYVTSLGLYELELNGRRVGDWLFTPGWTSYNFRLQYQTYDIGQYLTPGSNAFGALLGEGWYGGRVRGGGQPPGYSGPLALLAQIEIRYTDGRTQVICTDPSWASAASPLLKSDIYDGEDYDARLERPGWSTAGFDARAWAAVKPLERSHLSRLVAQYGPPVRRIDTIRPIAILPSPQGQVLVDMGQNMVGWLRLRVRGEAGTTVTLRHAEVLDQAGRFYIDNLRDAQQTDRYTLKGGGVEVYEPRFTFHGFRYVLVEGHPGALTLDDLEGIVVHSDLPPTGRFECSSPLLNQLQHNILWGQKGNFLDVPTDCPQRDERLGWTGDAQAFLRTAAFNLDVAAFMTKWLRDLAADQKPDGAVPFTVPDVGRGDGATGWGDAAVICPWMLYQHYGDRRILEEQYGSMAAWIGFMRRQTGDKLIWDTGFHFADWLAVEAPDPQFPNPVSDPALVATAYFAYSTSLMEKTARVLGREADAADYATLFNGIRAAFCAEFVSPHGRIAGNSQTAYVLALQFDLLPPEQRPVAAGRLAADIVRRGHHLTTGFLGTSHICHVLSQHGYLDLAYALLEQETYPSWLYNVKLGATTSWERWDNIRPDGSFQTPNANSFNHYAFGAIGDWLYRVVAGLDIDLAQPGYQLIHYRPRPGGSLTYAQASLETPYGRAESGWKREDASLRINVTVPPNAAGIVHLPARSLDAITESGQPLAAVTGIRDITKDVEHIVIRVGSGQYAFDIGTG